MGANDEDDDDDQGGDMNDRRARRGVGRDRRGNKGAPSVASCTLGSAARAGRAERGGGIKAGGKAKRGPQGATAPALSGVASDALQQGMQVYTSMAHAMGKSDGWC